MFPELFLGFVSNQKANYKGEFLSYKWIGDCAYPMRLWIYSPFKGCAEGLEGYKINLSFIQSSICMCVDHAFEILKGR